MRIKINSGLPQWLVEYFGLREGRAGFEQSIDLDSGVVPVVVLASDTGAGGSSATGGTLQQYFYGNVNLAASPGNLSLSEVRNPAGTGRAVYVDRIEVVVPPNTNVVVRQSSGAQLANASASTPNAVNKQIGQANGVSLIRFEQRVGSLNSDIAWKWADGFGNCVFDFEDGPIRLDPGAPGIGVEPRTVNVLAQVTYHLREVTIT